MALTIFLDTSVLLAGLVDFGPQSAPSQSLMHGVAEKTFPAVGTAWHCCLEFYSVSTRLPPEFRLTPSDAARLLRRRSWTGWRFTIFLRLIGQVSSKRRHRTEPPASASTTLTSRKWRGPRGPTLSSPTIGDTFSPLSAMACGSKRRRSFSGVKVK